MTDYTEQDYQRAQETLEEIEKRKHQLLAALTEELQEVCNRHSYTWEMNLKPYALDYKSKYKTFSIEEMIRSFRDCDCVSVSINRIQDAAEEALDEMTDTAFKEARTVDNEYTGEKE